MPRDRESRFKLAEFLLSCGVVGASAAGAPIPAGIGQALTAGGGLWALLRRRRNASTDAVVADFSDELRKHWQSWAATAGHNPAAMESAARSFEDVLPHLAALPDELVGVRLDPDALSSRALDMAAEAMPEVYGNEDPRNKDSHLARTFLRLDMSPPGFTAFAQRVTIEDAAAPGSAA